MKKFLVEVGKFILVFVVIVLFCGTAGYVETNYTRTGVVDKIENDVLIIVDTSGYEWEYESNKFDVGDTVKMRMFDAGTNDIRNDVILGLKKIN